MLALTPRTLILTILLGSFATTTQAETLSMPDQHDNQAVKTPERGSLQSAVLKQFGKPASKSARVGKPAISSWTYNDFKVFFENNRVIHSIGKL